MPFRSAVRRLLPAAVACVAVLSGLAVTNLAASAGEGHPPSSRDVAMLDSFDDLTTPAPPVVARRSVALATLVTTVALVTVVSQGRQAARASPRPAVARHRVLGLRAPPLARP